MLDLVVITGATRGIGNSVLRDCVAYSKKIVAIGSSAAIFDVVSINPSINALKLDLAEYSDIEAPLKSAIGDLGPRAKIGVVLCGAQIGSHGGLSGGDLAEWGRLYSCNVLGNLAVIQTLLEGLAQESSLRSVFFAGGGAAYGYPEFSGYALTKVAVVRAVENLGMEFCKSELDASIVALAPGAVATGMLDIVVGHGGAVRTRTDISEPTSFVRRFLLDELDVRNLNGRFIHVRDDLGDSDLSKLDESHFRLRRVQ